ncbi:uncharacterized protein PV09_05183 [Verruconis gallopava]|uniref:Epoxide hydrolase domain-like phosphatase n=1 Tax=Verruconis gallopava TaxID=253628 RepID=A0A0D2A9I2_9PEZI|nr:uncharacterized protein PV09_05183 [Verruconis gallopava]KIW03408.1 hypothetical protein PV09_05183 [Verruconis gallopava]
MGNPPKALLFDIGGVCVISPFQAILDYELANDIPPGYINHTISATAPNGAWQQIERGEVPLDDAWFAHFKSDLQDRKRWEWYWGKILSDPKKANLIPEKHKAAIKAGKIPEMPDIDAKTMFWNMMRNARSPDPYMYPALKKLKASGRFIMAALSNNTIFPEGIVDETGKEFVNGIPHDEIAEVSKKAGHAHVLPSNGERLENLHDNFDIFMGSAQIGMRKPEPRIYEYAIKEIQKIGRARGIDIKPSDIIFLDDIGSNLKGAKLAGMGTIKVNLGRTKEAVKELQERVGMQLLGEDSRL